MPSKNKLSVISTLLLAGVVNSAYAISPVSFKHPYFQVTGGGSTYISQSAHGRLQIFDTTEPPLSPPLADDYIYSRMQQLNALGPAFSLAAGFYLNEIFRVALQLSYFQADSTARTLANTTTSDDGTTTSNYSAKTWLTTANVYANLAMLFPLISQNSEPYVGAGLGVANNALGKQTTYYDGSATTGVSAARSRRDFAYKIMAGINYGLTANLLFSMEYALVHAGQYETGSTGTAAGVRFLEVQTLKFPIYANQFTAGFIYKV